MNIAKGGASLAAPATHIASVMMGVPQPCGRVPGTTAEPGIRIGVLLSNLGTPDGTDYWSMRRYLAEFLSDRRVIELPRLRWLPILHGIILTTRPSRKGKDYRKIWNTDRDESPLKTITRSQAERLRARLAASTPIAASAFIAASPSAAAAPQIVVEWGMRYGNPSLASALASLLHQGCDRVLLVPLYPQYSAATTATACDKTFQALATMRRQPALRVAPPYFEDDIYIEELANSVTGHLAGLDFEPEILLASFHGMPEETRAKGDPYFVQCQKTGELLRERLALPPERFQVTFQSRFGPAAWLTPYTDATVKSLAARGVKRLAVVTPGFSADCLETIEEIGEENARYFLNGGGEKFTRIPCLNDSEGGLRVIESLVRRELAGWL
ncbi:MAG TPA: ferrochelatase [Acetobacteraceae bacterium]|nr:ferrochelatase [Acetobacteraceae bacterium]